MKLFLFLVKNARLLVLAVVLYAVEQFKRRIRSFNNVLEYAMTIIYNA